jgi:hypothetical protein
MLIASDGDRKIRAMLIEEPVDRCRGIVQCALPGCSAYLPLVEGEYSPDDQVAWFLAHHACRPVETSVFQGVEVPVVEPASEARSAEAPFAQPAPVPVLQSSEDSGSSPVLQSSEDSGSSPVLQSSEDRGSSPVVQPVAVPINAQALDASELPLSVVRKAIQALLAALDSAQPTVAAQSELERLRKALAQEQDTRLALQAALRQNQMKLQQQQTELGDLLAALKMWLSDQWETSMREQAEFAEASGFDTATVDRRQG